MALSLVQCRGDPDAKRVKAENTGPKTCDSFCNRTQDVSSEQDEGQHSLARGWGIRL